MSAADTTTQSDATGSPALASPHMPRVLLRARRRVNIALAIIEDGEYDLLTPQDLAHILSLALGDFDEFEDEARRARGLDWNGSPFAN